MPSRSGMRFNIQRQPVKSVTAAGNPLTVKLKKGVQQNPQMPPLCGIEPVQFAYQGENPDIPASALFDKIGVFRFEFLQERLFVLLHGKITVNQRYIFLFTTGKKRISALFEAESFQRFPKINPPVLLHFGVLSGQIHRLQTGNTVPDKQIRTFGDRIQLAQTPQPFIIALSAGSLFRQTGDFRRVLILISVRRHHLLTSVRLKQSGDPGLLPQRFRPEETVPPPAVLLGVIAPGRNDLPLCRPLQLILPHTQSHDPGFVILIIGTEKISFI